MTRIIAGTVGGRRLEVPKGDLTRPTSDRVREAVFSGLDSRGVLHGSRVLDLFAGSGALGLEAASRGAAEVTLVDSSRAAAEVARRNVSALGMRATVVLSSAQRFLTGRSPVPMDVVLLDPPYAIGEDVVAEVLSALVEHGWLAPGGLVVLERSNRGPEPRWPAGLVREDIRRYGETVIWTAVAR
ncbi:MAG TPA: 16S rRNA (guanine(966)-N(2))-methyltransferase RsmD [Kineosporiaceae bacterium]|nr:16S rRNA (guanine(966)-N(2))-methyltransferase RsmD [Kineosporiaceae bacterium]